MNIEITWGGNVWNKDIWPAVYTMAKVLKDPAISKRVYFYIDHPGVADPKSLAAPYANARGSLVNVLGFTDDEAHNFITSQQES